MKFKVGDKVKFAGMMGEVISVDTGGMQETAIKCSFIDDEGEKLEELFSLEGKLFLYHKEPLLTLVCHQKSKVKKYRWLCENPEGRIMVTKDHYCKKEDIPLKGNCKILQKLNDTEIEVEEE